jgi:hypothetical protein
VPAIVVAVAAADAGIDEELIGLVPDGMRPGVVREELETIGEALVEDDLQGVVAASRLVGHVVDALAPAVGHAILHAQLILRSTVVIRSTFGGGVVHAGVGIDRIEASKGILVGVVGG